MYLSNILCAECVTRLVQRCTANPLQTCTLKRAGRGPILVVQAESEDKDRWSKQFSERKRKIKEGLPKVDSQPVQSAPRFASQKRKAGNVREQESQLLDFWTQETSFKLGGAVVLALLFVFLFVIGPP